MSIELFFLVNQVMDFSIIAVASRGLGVFRLYRVYAASVIAAVFAVMPQQFATPPVQLALLVLLSTILVWRIEPFRILSVAATLSVCAMASGALAGLIAGNRGLCVAALVTGAFGATMAAGCARIQRRNATLHPVRLRVVNQGRATRIEAVIDTGNRLHEPFSGQSVLIACESVVRPIMPETGYRAVSYGTVGGSGTLRCFRPESIYIFRHGAFRRAPEAWIAVLPNRLPDGVKALAPAEFG